MAAYTKVENFTSFQEIKEGACFGLTDLRGVMRDLNMTTNEILHIGHIIVDKDQRNKGLGSSVIRNMCESVRNNTVIIVFAGASTEEFKEEPSPQEINEVLEKLERFYTRNGFISVNNYIGQYETKCAYVYGNDTGRLIAGECNRRVREFNERR